MKWAIFVLLLVACSSAENGWQSAVNSVNGELLALRPTARAIAAIATNEDPASVRAVSGMCASTDRALERIARTRQTFHELDHEPGGPHHYMTDVADDARALVEHRHEVCRSDEWRCRDWCVQRWKALASSVDVLAARAAKHGVVLESLNQ